MNLIVEIQGSDWDRRWLIAASGTVRTAGGGEKNTENGSYRHTVQDRRQLRPPDSASSLARGPKEKLDSQRRLRANSYRLVCHSPFVYGLATFLFVITRAVALFTCSKQQTQSL